MESTSLSKQTSKLTKDLVSEISDSSVAEHARRSLDEARAGAAHLATQSNEVIRRGATRAREAVADTTDQTARYVQAQPLKSLLMALAAGAGIALLASALNRHHRERD